MTYIIILMVSALTATIVLECFVALLCGVKSGDDYLEIVQINCITNPVVNVVMTALTVYLELAGSQYRIVMILLELAVVFVEYLFYRKRLVYSKINLLLFSFLLNGVSWLTGQLVNVLV